MSILSSCLLCALAWPGEDPEPPRSTVIERPPGSGVLALREIDGGGRIDLFFIEPYGVGIRYQRDDGSYPEEHDTVRSWPGPHLAWDVVDLDLDGFQVIIHLFQNLIKGWRRIFFFCRRFSLREFFTSL